MYIGPETILPLASVFAAIGGVILMFWRKVVGLSRMTFQAVIRVFSRLFASR